MSDTTRVKVGRILAAASVAGTVVALLVLALLGRWDLMLRGYVAHNAIVALVFGLVAWVALGRQPRNRAIWVLLIAAGFGALFVVGSAFMIAASGNMTWDALSRLSPSQLSPLGQIAALFVSWCFIPALLLIITLGLLLFPSGDFSNATGKVLGWLSVGLMVVASAAALSQAVPTSTLELSADSSEFSGLGRLVDPALLTLLAVSVLAIAGVVHRYLSSEGELRQQYRWILFGTGCLLVGLAAGAVTEPALGYTPFSAFSVLAGELVAVLAYGIAITRYRLYDVDVFISRTVVVAGLAAFVTLVYAVLVGAVGLVVGFRTGATLPLSIAATVVVAIAFQPLRLRMRHWADRLVYGERATPYEVLSRFADQMSDTVATEDAIPQLAQLVALGTAAERASVWIKTDEDLSPVAVWPEGKSAATPTRSDGEIAIAGVDHTAWVEHDGELLGAVTITMPPGEVVAGPAERLVDDVASQAGLVFRNARLTADLVDTIAQLRSSRQRLVAAQDEERRRLERDLHDGAQQQFIAVKMKVNMAQRLASDGEGQRSAEVLSDVLTDLDTGVQSLRDLAHGIYPPLLEAEGLSPAIRARASKAPIVVSVVSDVVDRYPREIESAIYFCILEAIQNAFKYSHADEVEVTLDQQDGQLVFKVADEGTGFDRSIQPPGSGLTNMFDRLDALGGTLTVQSAPGEGTTVTGAVPL